MKPHVPYVVFTQPNVAEIWELEPASIGSEDVGIRTLFSGISQGTERLSLEGKYNRMGDNPSLFYPCSPGYQAVGIVDALGANVTDVKTGDLVFTQRSRLADPNWKYPGPNLATHGKYLVANRREITVLPAGLDPAGASLYQMAAVSMHGVRLTGIQPGELVVVIGQGMIGQLYAQAARLRGARVIAADVIAERIRISGEYSADRCIDSKSEDLAEVVRKEAPKGADVVVDSTGNAALIKQCIGLVREEGRICLQGYYPGSVSFDFHETHLKRVGVFFPCGWDGENLTGLGQKLLAGDIRISPLITQRFPYSQAIEAYDLIVNNPSATLGVVLDWQN